MNEYDRNIVSLLSKLFNGYIQYIPYVSSSMGETRSSERRDGGGEQEIDYMPPRAPPPLSPTQEARAQVRYTHGGGEPSMYRTFVGVCGTVSRCKEEERRGGG